MTRVSTHTPRSLEGKSRQHAAGIDSLSKRPGMVPAEGIAIYAIEVFEVAVPVVAGDEAFEWQIPEDLDGAVLLKVEAYVNTPSSSGTVQVQIANERAAGGTVDMLSTVISIDVGELNSKDAGTQPVVNPANEEVAWGDHLRIDVDAAGDALGLGVIAYFVPLATKTVALTGAKGDPGGVTAWTGPWATATGYSTGEAVNHGGTTYVATTDHTSGAASEPGVGVDWEDFWMPLVEARTQSGLEWYFSGGGYELDPGLKAFLEVPFDCEIVECTLLGDAVGSLVVDIWKDTYANYPPTAADSIVGSSPPTLNVEQKSKDVVLSGWTTLLSEGDVLAFHVDSCSDVRAGVLSLKVDKQ